MATEPYLNLGLVSRSSPYLMRTLQTDICGSMRGSQEFKQLPDRRCGPACQKQLNREGSNGLSINRSSTMRGKGEAPTLSNMMESSREPKKHARKKLEILMEAAMRCKLRTTKRPNKLLETDSETKGSNNIHKTKHACIVEAHESTRKRMESTSPKDHEDHIAEKGFNSLSDEILCTSLLLCSKQ